MAAGAPRPRRRAAAARARTLVSPYTVVGRSTVSLGVASRGVVGPKTQWCSLKRARPWPPARGARPRCRAVDGLARAGPARPRAAATQVHQSASPRATGRPITARSSETSRNAHGPRAARVARQPCQTGRRAHVWPAPRTSRLGAQRRPPAPRQSGRPRPSRARARAQDAAAARRCPTTRSAQAKPRAQRAANRAMRGRHDGRTTWLARARRSAANDVKVSEFLARFGAFWKTQFKTASRRRSAIMIREFFSRA